MRNEIHEKSSIQNLNIQIQKQIMTLNENIINRKDMKPIHTHKKYPHNAITIERIL